MGFDDAPMLVFWETTQACSLACRHCRARAVASPAPGELTPQEGTRLINELGRFGPRPPVLVLTGGDVMARPDLLDLVGAARQAGLPVALAPSVTPRLTREALVELRGLGVNSVSISLDGATAGTHEQIRGTPGHFSQTLSAMRQVGELGFKLQVNTAIMRANVGELARIAVIVKEVRAASWELFFLVKVGRGLDQEELSAEENEDVAHLLFEASRYGFAVRAVEGPWCRRVAAWRNERLRTSGPVPAGSEGPATWFELGPLYQQQSRQLVDLMGPPQGPPSSSTAGLATARGSSSSLMMGGRSQPASSPYRSATSGARALLPYTATIPFCGPSVGRTSRAGAAVVSSATFAAARGREHGRPLGTRSGRTQPVPMSPLEADAQADKGHPAQRPFVVMAKPVGPVCNLTCNYCYYLPKTGLFPPGERYRMSDEVLEAYVRSFIEASPGPLVHFVWHGGEPTLAGTDFYRRALALQERYLPEGWDCLNSLQTNGTLLDGKWCAFLAERRFAVGVSIDGPAPLHDPSRTDHLGRPSHARALRGFHLLREHGVDPDVLCTVNSLNADRPLEVYRYFLDQKARWVQFIPVVERQQDGGASERSVTPEAFGEFLCEIFDEWVRHDVGVMDVQNFLEALLVVTGLPPNLCVMAETCGRALAIEHDGSVYSCDHFVDPSHRLGELGKASLGPLSGSAQQVAFGRAKRASLPFACMECPVLFLCNGGCPKDRFAAAPDGSTGLNYLCGGYRRFYMHALPYLQRMAVQACSGRRVSGIMADLRDEERDERRRWLATGRNEPCPCGSGKKYKQCCLYRVRR